MSRPIPNVTLGGFRPNQVKINSIGIGVIDDETLNSLNLNSSQYMVVGGQTNDTYSLIVDSEGVIINSSLQNRTDVANSKDYALYVDGSIFVNGKVDTRDGTLSNVAGGGGGYACNYWLPVIQNDSTNIFYDGKINIANQSHSRNNAYRVNIVDDANRTIMHSQLAIQNQVGSIARMGILGYSNVSPVIINSSKGAIEFHANRNASYFDSVYYRGNVGIGIGTTVALNLPYYTCNALAPHLAINQDGNVGIKASPNPPLTYTIRTVDGLDPHIITPTTVTNKPVDLHVNGTTFSCNMLIYNYESKSATNIDDLYVRRLGVTLAASQIIPGSFAPGNYTFVSNLSIGGPVENEFKLSVYGKAHITDQLYADKAVLSSNLTVQNTFEVLGTSYFDNDVIVNDNLQVNENLIIWGGFYADSNALYTFVPGVNSNEIAPIQFVNYVAQGWSNIYMQGAGFITPGTAGIGINPNETEDQVTSQLTVISRDKYIYELSLYDKTNNIVDKALFIGHQRSNTIFGTTDASVIFSTPSSTSPYFTKSATACPQNIYFYPGEYDKALGTPNMVREDNPPTLSVYETKQVAVNSFEPDPALQLYVNGSIGYSSNLYKYNKNDDTITRIAEFKYAPLIGFTNDIGISYTDPDAPHVGINRSPNRNYGLSVDGGIFVDTYYTADDQKGYLWLDSDTDPGIINPTTTNGMHVHSKVGIGINHPDYLLDLYGDNADINNSNGTYIRLKKSSLEGLSNTGIRFDGASESKAWFTNMETISSGISRFVIGTADSVYDLNQNTAISNGITIQYDTFKAGHQVVIGGNSSLLDNNIFNPNPNPNAILTVNGDTSIIGNLTVSGYITTSNQNYGAGLSDRSNIPSIEQDDLFISGKDIYLNPTNKLYLNYTCNLLDSSVEQQNKAVLNIYQDIDNNITPYAIAHFISKGTKAFIEIVSGGIQSSGSGNDGILRLGIFSGNIDRQVFSFQDGYGDIYMSFVKGPIIVDNQSKMRRSMGINTEDPQAQLQIVNNDTTYDQQMLLLTYDNGVGEDTQNYSPNIILDKTYKTGGNTINKQWIIEGPKYGTGNDRLSFTYLNKIKDSGGNTNSISSTILSITSNGCIGVNTTSPKYLLDIVSSNIDDNHGLRLWNKTSGDLAQLIFQSGESADIGGDIYTDYVMYSCNNEFIFKQRNSGDNITNPPLLHFNSNTNLGILSTPNNSYDVNLGGKLNVTESIYIGGKLLINSTDYVDSGYVISGSNNIYLRPDVENSGGVVINGIVPTSNLFHIFNDNTSSPNMTVYDSILDSAEINFRNKKTSYNTYNLYKLYTFNENFGLSYQKTYNRSTTLPATGWSNVFNIHAVSETNYNEHDVTLNGTLTVQSDIRGTPKILFGSNGEIGGNNSDGSMYIIAGNTTNIGIGTTIPTAPLHVHRNVIMGQGLAGGNADILGGPFFKQASWDTIGTTHTIQYPSYCVGDNSTGTIYIQISNKIANSSTIKLANVQISFIKQYTLAVVVNEISSHKNNQTTNLSINASGNDIIVNTDSDCYISWTSIGSH